MSAANRPTAILVAHGSPADPEPQEAVMKALALRVAMSCPGWRILGATLAAPGALEAAVAAGVVEGIADGSGPLIYPFFMAEGWFTRTNLPRRLRACGGGALRRLAPFGTDPALPALMARAARDGAAAAGLTPGQTTLLIAAHGGKASNAPADSARAMVAKMEVLAGFGRVTAGFVEQTPFLRDAATGIGPAVCLPFFALTAGHVAQDVPDALNAAGFQGPLLPPIGEDPGVGALIAAALRRGMAG
tara:strand:+ start:6739 stop:7476 length:738 start_codon:yes stop_codon:yes gene_type:complete